MRKFLYIRIWPSATVHISIRMLYSAAGQVEKAGLDELERQRVSRSLPSPLQSPIISLARR